ncbi:hypothetical protein [Streptomyces sp. LaPpAH-108]|uniref:hypothetical protein n=1 Tax=Streptomyces sp. LaPpAH-108 TaxID=1155714 RepID=UPI000361C7D0|nr:hypothetical protein [Streptomyces sp. LaPpAH-108]
MDDPHAEIMVPLVGTIQELETVRDEVDQVIAEGRAEAGTRLKLAIGTTTSPAPPSASW